MFGTVLLFAAGFILASLLVFWLIGERGRLMLPSTLAGMKAGGLRNVLNLNALHMYIYGRWTNRYLNTLHNTIFPRLGERGKKWWSDRYHGKILTQEHAEAIIMLDRDIELRGQEQIIPYPLARDIIIKGPPDVVVYECGCRSTRANPCLPSQVCMIIGKPFTDFVMEHLPKSSRRLTQSEALDLLRAEHEKGHMHSAWFKDACLNRFYVMCNCCKCCCGGIERMLKYGNKAIASSGYISKIDLSNCTDCGICADACPFGTISMEERAVVDWNKCMGCGVCTTQCPEKCITLVRDEKKGVPMDVRALA